MAEHGSMDIKEHEHSYGRFIGMLKFGIVVVAIIAAFVIFLITR